jgi:hypothetical protein
MREELFSYRFLLEDEVAVTVNLLHDSGINSSLRIGA